MDSLDKQLEEVWIATHAMSSWEQQKQVFIKCTKEIIAKSNTHYEKKLVEELESFKAKATRPSHHDDQYYFDIGCAVIDRLAELKGKSQGIDNG